MLPYIVEPELLATKLNDPTLLIVDLCRDETWRQAHLPGAVHVHPSELVSGVEPATGMLPGKERLVDLFSRLGLTRDRHVVAYDDEGGGWAGRLIWTLDVIGHSHHSYLNGGLVAWAGEGRPLTSADAPVTPSTVELTIDRAAIATREELLHRLDDPQLVIWDARSADEYSGNRKYAARGGHIPGAINLDWVETMDRDAGLRVRDDIGDLLASRGIDGEKEIITHCQTHHRSSFAYLIGKSLGYNIRGYDGSWSEWGNDPDTPIERTPIQSLL